MNRRQKIIVSITGIFLVLLILVGLTYGYFLTRIQGNTNEKSISATLANLEVTYEENDSKVITGEKIVPGAIFEKTFSVKNTGDSDASYSIILDEIESDFVRFIDWSYKLYNGTSASGDPIASGTIGHNDKQTIKSYETVTTTTPNEYTLLVTYENVNEDQSIDMNKNLSLRVNINTAKGTELMNAEDGTLLKAIGRDNNVTEPITVPRRQSVGICPGVMGENTYRMSISFEYQNYYWTYADGYEYDVSTEKYNLTGVHTGIYSEIYTQLVGKYLVSNYVNDNFSYTDVKKNTSNLSNVYQVASAELDNLRYKRGGEKKFEEAELSYAEDDYGTSYYYRGIVKNNYVNFAGMCWRIVRVEGDGSIKIILSDKDNTCNLETPNKNYSSIIGAAKFNNGTDPFVDFKNIKDNSIEDMMNKFLNGGSFKYYNYNWENVIANYEGISDSDKTKLKSSQICIGDVTNVYTSNGILMTESEKQDAIDRYNGFYYKKYVDYMINKIISYKCEVGALKTNETDIFLLTVDEVSYAGSYLVDNANDQNLLWYTINPVDRYKEFSDTGAFIVRSGDITYDIGQDDSVFGIRPAVSLVKDVRISNGNGTLEHPYEIE